MIEYIRSLLTFIFEPQNIWIVLLGIFTFTVYKLVIFSFHLRLTFNLRRSMEKAIDEKFEYSKILHDIESAASSVETAEVIRTSLQRLKERIQSLDSELDSLWMKRRETPFYRSGLSKGAADAIVQAIIRRIYFKYWQIQDLFNLFFAATSNEKATIANNLSGYANSSIEEYLDRLEADELICRYLTKEDLEKPIAGRIEEAKIIFSNALIYPVEDGA